MAKTGAPYAPEFRRQTVELVRSGRDPDDLAREHGPTARSIRDWVAGAGGRTVGREKEPASADVDELARLWREVRPTPAGARHPLKSGGLVRAGDRHSAVRVFGGVGAHQVSFPITAMAHVLGVSTAGYHAWLKRAPSAHARADGVHMQRIHTIHATSRATRRACRASMRSFRRSGSGTGASGLPG